MVYSQVCVGAGAPSSLLVNQQPMNMDITLYWIRSDSKFMENVLIFVQITHMDFAIAIEFGCSFLISKFT